MCAVKPNRSRSGPVSRPARVVAPTSVNGGQVERDRGGSGPLADDHVDPEVLHRHVEQFLGRTGDAVDLVDEQHLALGEAGEQRGQVAGALDRRAAGHPDRGAELGGDDHREAGLAEPGRPGQQDVVGRALAAQRRLEHQLQLLADLGLPDELAQVLRPQRRLDLPLLRDGQGAHQVLGRLTHGRGPVAGRHAATDSAAGPRRSSGSPEQLDGLAQQGADVRVVAGLRRPRNDTPRKRDSLSLGMTPFKTPIRRAGRSSRGTRRDRR